MTRIPPVLLLVFGVASVAPGPALGGPDGPALFRKNCALCHGAERNGATPMAKALGRSALDLTDEASRALTPAAIEATIREGKGRMPAWGTRLEDSEVAALVEFLRSAAATPATSSAGSTSRATAPVSVGASRPESAPATLTR